MTPPVPPVPPEPPEGPKVLTKDPVRVAWVSYAFIQAVIVVLLATDSISQRTAAIISGVAVAAYIAISELFVRPETVPRRPLEELAYEERLKNGNADSGR